ncbi:unnamed protein product [Adineta ricciae]|uniref:Cyclic nucleotide-binding domain-containing protein n=1 Tax=Adineta ricciae TaxID=249248 RepID=A0A815A2K4_ADIRI|nr:unnamed protein product [Adineta ricciae]CAF1309420.1 unnamed protein product [Adineta ricciae]
MPLKEKSMHYHNCGTIVQVFSKTIGLFHSLTDDEIKEISMNCSEISFKENEFVINQGQKEKTVYFVKTGSVIFKSTNSEISSSFIQVLRAGEYFGIKGLFLNQNQHGLSVQALENTNLYCMNGDKFEKYLVPVLVRFKFIHEQYELLLNSM